MDRFVAQANIKRFQDMLEATRDPVERRKLQDLIEHEQERLEAAIRREEAQSSRPAE
jgi:hypothetical protein